MAHFTKKQSQHFNLFLIAIITFVVSSVGVALADPPTGVPTFAKADISIETRDNESQEVSAGGLTCSWQETGLGSYELVTYDCAAGAVGALEGCVYKNKYVSGSPNQLSIFHDVTGGEHGEGAVFISNNSGRINGSTTTAVPESHGGGELCAEPTEAAIVAVRWCNASLTDLANNLVGVTATELYEELVHGFSGNVPSCAELLASSPSP